MLFFFLIHLALFVFLFFRLLLPLRLSKKAGAALALALFLVTQHYLVRFAFDSLSTPELPAGFIMAEGWAFMVTIILFLLTLCRDFFLLARFCAARLRPRPRAARTASKAAAGEARDGEARAGPDLPGRRRFVLGMLAVAAVPAAVGVERGAAMPKTVTWTRRPPSLPRGLDGLRLAHLTDLHVSRLFGADRVRALVERVNALEPDLVLFTGDLVDGDPAKRADDVAALGDLRARCGVFGCPGNHEYYSGYAFWMSRLEELGMRMLENRHAVVEANGEPLVVAGLCDPVGPQFGLPGPDAAQALAGAPEGAFTILLDHRPTDFARNTAAGADLQLSGHTHGGHITGMDRLVARFNGGYVYGWYASGGASMYVSSGTGLWNGFPVRMGVDAEIACITLRAREA